MILVKNLLNLARNVYKFNDERAKIKLAINNLLVQILKKLNLRIINLFKTWYN